MVFALFEAHAFGEFDHLAVDAGAEALLVEGFEFFAELAFAAADDGGVDGDALAGRDGVLEIDNRLGEAQNRAAPIIADREKALANFDYLSAFANLDPYPPQLSVLARVAENLPSNGAQIAAWSYQSGDLQFTVFSPASSLDILFYVKTYSSVPGFNEVAAERAEGPRSLRVKLHLAK